MIDDDLVQLFKEKIMKKFLLATAAVLMSTSAYAADYGVVHPFYTPTKGKFVSTTSFDYLHSAIKQKIANEKMRDSQKTVSEAVEYGVTDDVQIGVSVSRDWAKTKNKGDFMGVPVNEKSTDYTNAWSINAGYNIINDGKAFLNVGLTYSQNTNTEKNMGEKDKEHAKNVALDVFGGYNFDAVTVFGGIGYDRQVDGEKEAVAGSKDEKTKLYTLEAGVFKAFNDQISARTSLSADIDETKDSKERTYWWNVGVGYSIAKNMAFGVNASYMIDNDVDDHTLRVDTHRAYRLGMDFTIEF